MISALQRGRYKPAFVLDAEGNAKARAKRTRQPPVEVRLHNDDYTPAEYVVAILGDVFKLGFAKATWVMLRAHLTGEAVIGVYPRKVAEKRVATAEGRARRDGWPLRLSIVETDAGGE